MKKEADEADPSGEGFAALGQEFWVVVHKGLSNSLSEDLN
jgi:hypothetical protein